MAMPEPEPQVEETKVVSLQEVKKNKKEHGVEDEEKNTIVPNKPASQVLESIHAEAIAVANATFPKVIEKARIMHPNEICRDVRPTLRLDDRVLEAISKKLGVDEIEHIQGRIQTQLELADLLKSHDTLVSMVNKIARLIGLTVNVDGVDYDFKAATPTPVMATVKAMIYIECRTIQLEERWMNFERIEKELRERLHSAIADKDELDLMLREATDELRLYESLKASEKARPTRNINLADDFAHHVVCARASDEFIRIKLKDSGAGIKIADIPRNKIVIVRSMAEASRLTEKRAKLLMNRLPRILKRDAARFTVGRLILQMAD
jgi:hypothetical protein